jgi:hypothetical protein
VVLADVLSDVVWDFRLFDQSLDELVSLQQTLLSDAPASAILTPFFFELKDHGFNPSLQTSTSGGTLELFSDENVYFFAFVQGDAALSATLSDVIFPSSEPGTLVLLLAGLAVLRMRKRRGPASAVPVRSIAPGGSHAQDLLIAAVLTTPAARRQKNLLFFRRRKER